jgi:hypothetical protein
MLDEFKKQLHVSAKVSSHHQAALKRKQKLKLLLLLLSIGPSAFAPDAPQP